MSASGFVRVDALTIRVTRPESVAPLIHGISLTVDRGQSATIVGETGAGKSLLLQAIAGYLPAGLTASGSIRAAGIRTLPAQSDLRSHWGRKLFLLPQEPGAALDPSMSVAAQVSEISRYAGGASQAESIRIAREKLRIAGLDPVLDGRRFPCELSGGMSQRALIAMAMASPAELILIDEPTKNLDARTRLEVSRLLRSLVESGKTLLAVSHDTDLAAYLGGKRIVIHRGKNVESSTQGEPAEEQQQIDSTRRVLDPFRGTRPLILADDLSFRYGPRQPVLFSGFTLRIHTGEIVGLTGPSGAGKTTVGDILVGIRKPSQGNVQWDGLDVYNASGAILKSLRTHYQKVYQDPGSSFPPHQTMRRALTDVLNLKKNEVALRSSWQDVERLARQLGLREHLFDRFPCQLSGGEIQRFAFLRVWMLRPRFVVADEPTSRLDPAVKRETIQLLRRLASGYATAVLLISHDHAVVESVADQIVTLSPNS